MSTYVNPRPQSVRLVLSDGSGRTIRAWGLAFLPDALQVQRASSRISSSATPSPLRLAPAPLPSAKPPEPARVLELDAPTV
jgi:hypothetical protein